MHIGILGAGRLGRSLADLLQRAGHQIDLQGRDSSYLVGTAWSVPVALLTVPDQAIGEVAAALVPGPIVLHCSGSHTIEPLRPHRPAGSLHPLMTFPGPEVALPDLRGVAAALAGDPEAIEVGRQIATSLGMRPIEVSGDRRLYHAAAVMAGNFGTALLAAASEVLAAAGVSEEEAPSILAPLALASLRNASTDPARSLTGPAARGDLAVIEAHRQALQDAQRDDLLDLYDVLDRFTRKLATRRR